MRKAIGLSHVLILRYGEMTENKQQVKTNCALHMVRLAYLNWTELSLTDWKCFLCRVEGAGNKNFVFKAFLLHL